MRETVSHQDGIRGCHMVGSISGCPDAHTAFTQCVQHLPGRLKRIPDGEPGMRNFFVYPQFSMFSSVPQLVANFEMNKAIVPKHFSDEEISQGIAQLRELQINTGYDDAAIESYGVFKKLKEQGVIPKQARFQVCLPTAANVVIVIYHQFRAAAFEAYEAGLFRAMRKIQAEIPHEELSIQLDMSVDSALWEGRWETHWFGDEDPKEAVLRYTLRMISQVEPEVELGLHNCYGILITEVFLPSSKLSTDVSSGDMEHKHFFEPSSLQPITERTLALFARTSHKIAYSHCPVPQSAMSFLPEYYAPLKTLYPTLRAHGCELYLGVVVFNDTEGTQTRIDEARKLAPKFGVATGCGFGRTPASEIEGTMRLMKEVSEPVL